MTSSLIFASRREHHRFEAHFKLFNNEPSEQEQVIVFHLVSSKDGWRIDDIIYPHEGNASLKAVLAALP